MTAGGSKVNASEKTERQKVIERLEAALENARRSRQWVAVKVAGYGNWSLNIVIAPPTENRDATPILVVQSPRFKNRLIIKDQEALNDLYYLLDIARKNEEKLRALFEWLSAKNPRTPRKTAVFEL